MATITLEEFRKVTENLPGSLVIRVREQDCSTMEWFDADLVLVGLKHDHPDQCVLLLSEAHTT